MEYSTSQSGKALWVNLNDGETYYFALQVTPNDSVGFSVIGDEEIDMPGHDAEFDSVELAIAHIKTHVTTVL